MQPFFHILATTIARDIGEDYPKEIIATTIVSFTISSVLTGGPRVDLAIRCSLMDVTVQG